MATNDDVTARVSGACTLPSAERPLRAAELDDLLEAALRGQQRLSPTRLRWRLDPAAEQAARDLTRREAECCSFFSFTFILAGSAADGEVQLDIAVPEAYAAVLDALADRAAARTRS